MPTTDRLIIVDSEVDETPFFSPINLFELTPAGTSTGGTSLASFSVEPTGVAYNPVTDSLFVTDDSLSTVFEVSVSNPGQILSQFSSSAVGVGDLEDVSVDPTTGNLFLADNAGKGDRRDHRRRCVRRQDRPAGNYEESPGAGL